TTFTKYNTRRESKQSNKVRLSYTDCPSSINNTKNDDSINGSGLVTKSIRFKLFPNSDTVEQFIANDMVTSVEFNQSTTTKSQLRKTNSATQQVTNSRQSLLRSPSARYTIPKFPVRQKSSTISPRVSVAEWNSRDTSLLSPPEKDIINQRSKSFNSNGNILTIKQMNTESTLRGALGAVSPDMYMQRSRVGFLDEDTPIFEENLKKLRLRIQYDDQGNDLIVNIIEAQGLPTLENKEFANPYVKLYLRPPVDQKLRQTSIQRQTINPCWNEYFKFYIDTADQLKSKTLFLYIYNYEHNSRAEFIGEIQIKLTQSKTNGNDLWCQITKQKSVS
ncbi:unnamed protein product, partial [Didymodactylos carnosus]